MASSSGRKSGSSGRSTPRKRVVIGAQETVRVRYHQNQPRVEAESKRPARRSASDKGAHQRKPAGARRAGDRVSAAKRQERERRQRVGQMRAAAVLVALLALLVVLVWGVASLLRAPVFALRTIEVVGAQHLSPAEVRLAARVVTGTPLPSVDVGAVETRLAGNPWIASARVERDYPSTLRVEIVERKPAAIVDSGGTNLNVVAADGTWLGVRSSEETGLVVIRDLGPIGVEPGERTDSKELLNALKLIGALSPQLRSSAQAISAPSIDKTLLLTTTDVEIFFGEAVDVKRKDQIARGLLDKYKDKVVYINVRTVDSPTWRGLDQAP